MGYDVKIDLADDHKAAEHAHHGGEGLARAAQRAAQDIVDAGEQIEGRNPHHKQRAVIEHLGLLIEQAQQRLGKCHQRNHQRAGAQRAHGQRHPRAALGARYVARAQVLPHKGGVGRAEGLLRQQGKLIELAVNGPARRAVRAEGVDIGLHEYVGKRGDRALQGGGQADAYNLPEHRQLDAQPAEEQLIRAVRARQHI